MVSLMNELLQHSPSNTRGIQPNILSSSLEVHDLKFACGVTMVRLCRDGERRMIGRPGSRDAGNSMLGYVRDIACSSGVLGIDGL